MEIQEMKYKVVQKVVATDEDIETYELDRVFTFQKPNLIAYKIIAGLYIFYITAAVYEQGVSANIIEPVSERLPEENFIYMRQRRGMLVNHRMSYALELSTLKCLMGELKRANSDSKLLTVKVFRAEWWKNHSMLKEPILTYLEEIKVDILNRSVLYNNSRPSPLNTWPLPVFYEVDTYESFLDRLARELDREFMNSRNLYDKFKDANFYEVDQWSQRLYKFAFIFE